MEKATISITYFVKSNKSKSMKTISSIAILAAIIFSSCGPQTTNNAERSYYDNKATEIFTNVHYQIVVIDSCEYIIGSDNHAYNGGYFLSHKGNCKFCMNRSKKQ